MILNMKNWVPRWVAKRPNDITTLKKENRLIKISHETK